MMYLLIENSHSTILSQYYLRLKLETFFLMTNDNNNFLLIQHML
jgi:hypothetical protein